MCDPASVAGNGATKVVVIGGGAPGGGEREAERRKGGGGELVRPPADPGPSGYIHHQSLCHTGRPVFTPDLNRGLVSGELALVVDLINRQQLHPGSDVRADFHRGRKA